jgi:hypothetical protein
LNEQAKELSKMLGDVDWRLDNLYYIKDKQGQKVKFVRNESQQRLWENKWYLNLILKDRQRGFSTFIAIIILDTCLWNKNQACGIVDLTLTDAKKKLEKIKFAYESLPQDIQEAIPLLTDSKQELTWGNGSSVYVGTSHRGGTLQVLHISESGKISARTPDKAREIRTGALNTIAPGCFVFNESTAEGREGEFFEDCQEARKLQDAEAQLTPLDYRFHFFAWWMGEENEMDPEGVVITKEQHDYFDKIEQQTGAKLTPRKRAWYAKKSAQQKDDMKREYPSTPDEAFEAAIDGAYFATEMAVARRQGRICRVPHTEGYPVRTWWDLGMDDSTSIWFHQLIGREHRLINYLEDSGRSLSHYVKELDKLGYIYSEHYLPHDVSVRELGTGKKRIDTLTDLGLKNIKTVPRASNQNDILDGIEASRRFLMSCYIDDVNCAAGIKHLDNYRKDWDAKLGAFKRTPRHDSHSHGADSLRTGTVGYDPLRDLGFHERILTQAEKDWREVTGQHTSNAYNMGE